MQFKWPYSCIFSCPLTRLWDESECNLFPKAIDLVDEIRPKAVMLENVREILDSVFDAFRQDVETQLKRLGYASRWRLLNASDFGVSLLRPRVVLAGIRNDLAEHFQWPTPLETEPQTVGRLVRDLMAANGWEMSRRALSGRRALPQP